jgi:sulfoxide reductase heme-binding subunit YedZ
MSFKFTKFQIAVHFVSLIPLAWLIWDYFNNNLTANPIQAVTFRTGDAAIRLLVASLACTPINTIFGFNEALKVRRPLGLYAFMYAALHFFVFVGLDYGLDWALIYEAIFEKRYALVGLAAFLILLPLAATSTRWWMQKLGKNWKRLHRLVYVAAILAVIHYIWLVKSDIRTPLIYGAIVAASLLVRIPAVRKWLTTRRGQFEKWRQMRLTKSPVLE